jgi:hypothetical protein
MIDTRDPSILTVGKEKENRTTATGCPTGTYHRNRLPNWDLPPQPAAQLGLTTDMLPSSGLTTLTFFLAIIRHNYSSHFPEGP